MSLSLVEEIQAGALDPNVPVVDLLRRVKLAAAKLKLSETQDWVDRELNGYGGVGLDAMPRYRMGAGTLMCFTSYHGLRPAIGDPQMIAAISINAFRQSVGELESLIALPGDRMSVPIDVHIAVMLADNGNDGNYTIHFSKNAIIAITDQVRNLVLDWAIKLEGEGICGEGVTFTVEEKQKASEAGAAVNIYYNYGHHHQGDAHGHQNRTTVNGMDASTNSLSINVFEQLQSAVTNNIDNATDRAALLALIGQMSEKKGTNGFKDVYTSFLVAAANHMTVIAPFLPALAAYLPG